MPDASPMDPADILKRIETNIETQEPIGFTIAIDRSDAIQLCRLLRTALADTRRVDWRPIETAPMDETIVLISGFMFDRKDSERWISTAGFCADEGRWFSTPDDRDDQGPFYCPTHWMPLPAPPDAAMAATPREEN